MPPAPALSDITAASCFLCILLAPCAAAGLALMNAGLGRSRNVAHSLLGALTVTATAAVAYFAVGAAWQGYAGGPGHAVWIGGRAWGWIGAGRFLLSDLAADGSYRSLAAMFGIFAVALAAIIPLGAGAERWRLSASCASTAMLAGIVYPLVAHWSWGGGWLAQLGPGSHLGRGLIDPGGGLSIHGVGGMTALAMAWVLGARRGKYQEKGMPLALPAHNATLVLSGCFLAWLGFMSLDCAGALLYGAADLRSVAVVPLNVTLSAASALLAAAAVTSGRFGKTDASLCANAWVAGLVAASAGCAVMRPIGSVLTGAVSGALVIFVVEWLEFRCKVDDPAGAIAVHGMGGLWGILAVGLFEPAGGIPYQFAAQLAGAATLIGFVLPFAYGSNLLLDRLLPQRVDPEAERQGLDLYELGAGAYPEFMTHSED